MYSHMHLEMIEQCLNGIQKLKILQKKITKSYYGSFDCDYVLNLLRVHMLYNIGKINTYLSIPF